MLVALGLYLMGFTRFLVPFEHIGGLLWQKIQPIFRSLLPVKTIKQMLAVGFLWGWLPSGLVYSSLALAMTTGSVVGGMHAMLAFGVGTLPALTAVGLHWARFWLDFFTLVQLCFYSLKNGVWSMKYFILIFSLFAQLFATDGQKVFDKNCAGCHNMTMGKKEALANFDKLSAPPMLDMVNRIKDGITVKSGDRE
jgi:sulfite exporter TauE/SafE